MIHTLELENFKGFATRQRIDFAPLTLLFGPNNAGKSTILQALLYLHELIEHGSADVDRTELGGTVLELGGFARLVHRHDTSRAIVLRVEFATPRSLERFGRDLSYSPFPDLDDDIETAWLELTIRSRAGSAFRGPMLQHAAIGVNGHADPLVWLGTDASVSEGEPLYARINLGHPVLAQADRDFVDYAERIAIPEAIVLPPNAAISEVEVADEDDEETSEDIIPNRTLLGFPENHPLPVFAVSRSRLSALPPIDEPLRVIPFGNEDAEKLDIALQVRTFLEMVVLGTTAQLAAALRDALYIGPLRSIPPRGFLYERAGRTRSWADGLAAWDLLLADRSNLVERTNRWLDRLDAGCKVTVQNLFDREATAEDLSIDHVDKTIRRLLLHTDNGSLVLPSEVGAGVSQILPVIVAALEGSSRLVLVEQPELHIHPAIQVGLGDLFIEAVIRDSGRRMMLVETHSEHLILRLLRRIRQTTSGKRPEDVPAFSRDDLSVLHVETQPDGVRIRRLRVDEKGEFMDRWPKGFFAERMEELL
jgi:hypothetical protein